MALYETISNLNTTLLNYSTSSQNALLFQPLTNMSLYQTIANMPTITNMLLYYTSLQTDNIANTLQNAIIQVNTTLTGQINTINTNFNNYSTTTSNNSLYQRKNAFLDGLASNIQSQNITVNNSLTGHKFQ